MRDSQGRSLRRAAEANTSNESTCRYTVPPPLRCEGSAPVGAHDDVAEVAHRNAAAARGEENLCPLRAFLYVRAVTGAARRRCGAGVSIGSREQCPGVRFRQAGDVIVDDQENRARR